MDLVEDLAEPGVSPGADDLPKVLQAAHMEIRPGPEMSRKAFKKALRELEP